MKKVNNVQKIKEMNKNLLQYRIALVLPILLLIIFLFSNALSFTGYYSIKQETDQEKNTFLVDFGEEADKGISLFDILLGDNGKVEITTSLTTNNASTPKEEKVLVLCPTVPGLLIAGIALVAAVILGTVPFTKKSKINMVQLLLSIVIIVAAFTFITLKVNELRPEFVEASRISVLKQIVGTPDYKDFSTSVEVGFSYQYILLGIALLADVVIKVIMLLTYRKKASIE